MQDILFHTFERFDGQGFPDCLLGEEIPLGARIIAVVDAFIHLKDMSEHEPTENPYRKALEIW